MLYDAKRYDPPPVVSLAGLVHWLERQPADTTYIWESCQHCLIGQYLEAMADRPYKLNCFSDVCEGFPAYFDIAQAKPHTTGAALNRARVVQTARAKGEYLAQSA